MEKFYSKKILIAIRISKILKGSVPQTDPEEPVGILTFKHPKGSHFPAHIHKPIKRITQHLEECFILKKGKIQIKLYGTDKKYFKSIYLKAGQAFLTINGGHEIKVLEDCEMFEIKNGPYQQDKAFI